MQTEVSSTAWQQLFAAASAFRAAAPWEWISDGQLFGVIDPQSGTRNYCSIMGSLGDYYALGVYPGSEGFRSYHMLFSDDIDEDPSESLYHQRCMVGAFENEEDLDEDDRMLAKSLHLEFTGDREWPNFRSYRPGYMPWAMDADEIRMMTVAYEQALVVANRLKDDPESVPEYDPAKPEKVLFRKQEDGAWTDVHLAADSPVALTPLQLKFDAADIKSKMAKWSKSEGLWLLEMFFLPKPVMEEGDERPYFPKAAVFLDMNDGRVLGLDAIKPEEIAEGTLNTMMELFDHFKSYPESMVVSNRSNYILLKEFCRTSGIELHLDEELDVIDELREDIFGRMGGE